MKTALIFLGFSSAADLSNLNIQSAPYELTCEAANDVSPSCLLGPEDIELPEEDLRRKISFGTLPRVELDSYPDASGWCTTFETPEGRRHHGFRASSYTAESMDMGALSHTVFGDYSSLDYELPSSAVLAYGKNVAGKAEEECGKIVAIKVKGSTDREAFVRISAFHKYTHSTQDIGDDEIQLFVSSKLLTVLCCADATCLDHSPEGDAPVPANCPVETQFDFRVIEKHSDIQLPQNMVVDLAKTFPTDDQNRLCPNQKVDTSPARVVEIDLSFKRFSPEVFPPQAGDQPSIESECGKVFRVFNANPRVIGYAHVTITEFVNLEDRKNGDSTYGLSIPMAECEKLCPMGCEAGQMGTPPLNCNLIFEQDPTRPDPLEWYPVVMHPWNDVADRCDFTCGAVVIGTEQPEDCGAADKPCFASFKDLQCGDVIEVKNGYGGGSVFVQVADTQQEDLHIAAPVWSTVCKKSCTGSLQTNVCRDDCELGEGTVPDYCSCSGCTNGSGKDSDNCECTDCQGQCMRLSGSTKAYEQQGYYRFIRNTELPTPSFGHQAIPLYALATTTITA